MPSDYETVLSLSAANVWPELSRVPLCVSGSAVHTTLQDVERAAAGLILEGPRPAQSFRS